MNISHTGQIMMPTPIGTPRTFANTIGGKHNKKSSFIRRFSSSSRAFSSGSVGGALCARGIAPVTLL
jgi:hypothetical protein